MSDTNLQLINILVTQYNQTNMHIARLLDTLDDITLPPALVKVRRTVPIKPLTPPP